MALSISIYGVLFALPSIDELIETLEESEFEITMETEESEEDWEELLVFESSLEGPIDVIRYMERSEYAQDLSRIKDCLENQDDSKSRRQILESVENCAAAYRIDVPDEMEDDDNALLIAIILAQTFVQRIDGFYCVDGEGFFDESGDLILEVAKNE
jgi:organic radical activating enzyme